MKRMSSISSIGGSLLLGTIVAVPGTADHAFAVDSLAVDNFRVVYEHTAFDGVTPLSFSPPYTSLEDSAYYSLRGLSINPTGGSDGGPSVYTSWLHGFGSRWILEHNLSDLTGASAPFPTHAARLSSDFTTRQTQPKSLTIDPAGNVYAAIRNGASGASDPISEVFIYDQDLDGDGTDFMAIQDDPDQLIDIDAHPALSTYLAEGAAIDETNNLLYVTSREAGDGAVVRYDISGPVPVLDTSFGIGGLPDSAPYRLPNTASIRGVGVSAVDGTVYIAEKQTSLLLVVTPGVSGPTLGGIALGGLFGPEDVNPHHLTIFEVDGVEFLVATTKERLIAVNTADVLDLGAYQVIDFPAGSFGSDASTTGFGQIDYHDGTLYWTNEDSKTEEVLGGGLDPFSLDLVSDQILALDISGVLSGLSSSVDSVSAIPEPGTLGALSLTGLMAMRRRRR